MQKYPTKTLLVDILFDLAGCFLFAISIQTFSAPNNIAPGGVTGVAILINYMTGASISLVNALFNIPLLVAAWFLLGRLFTIKTIKTVAIMTVFLEVCTFFPVYQGDMMLASLYGGVTQGIGLALVFMRSSTTGGTDVAARLLQLKLPHISMGKLLIAVDFVVLGASAVVYRNVQSALYAMIFIFVSGQLLDRVLYGMDMGKVLMIISERHVEIARHVNDEMGRGCTLLKGQGTYTSASRPVLLCAVRRQEFSGLKRLVHEVDRDAFVLVVDATEIIGEGFKEELQR